MLVMCGRDEANSSAPTSTRSMPSSTTSASICAPAATARPSPRRCDRLSLADESLAARCLARRSRRDRPEVVGKCWDHRGQFGLPPFVAIGDPRSLAAVWDGPIVTIDNPDEVDSAFDVGLPVASRRRRPDIPGCPSVAGALLASIRLRLASAWPVRAPPRRSSPARCRRNSSTASASPTRPDRIRRRTLRRCPRQRRDDAGRSDPADGPSPPTCPSRRSPPRSPPPGRGPGPRGARGLQRSFRHCRAAPRRRRASIPMPARGALGREEIDVIMPAIERLRAEGWHVTGPPGRHHVPRLARAALRRGPVHVPRPSADPVEGAPLRRRRQHHARPADRPHRARPWHRVRHRRRDRADPRAMAAAIRMAANSAATARRRGERRPSLRCAKSSPATACSRQGAWPEFHPRPAVARPDRRHPGSARRHRL